MTKEAMIVALDAMLEQGNQLRASELIPILAELASDAAPIEVEDLEALTNEQLDNLNVGDKVVKVTGKQKHTYIVSYKAKAPAKVSSSPVTSAVTARLSLTTARTTAGPSTPRTSRPTAPKPLTF